MHAAERFKTGPIRLNVPIFVAYDDDIGKKVFFAFLYRIANQYGFNNEYTMQAPDVRYLLREYVTNPHVTFEDQLSHVRIGNLASHVWSFRWLTVPATVEVEITEPKFCATWGYVLGRLSSEQLVEDIKDRIPAPEAQILDKYDRQYFRYTTKNNM